MIIKFKERQSDTNSYITHEFDSIQDLKEFIGEDSDCLHVEFVLKSIPHLFRHGNELISMFDRLGIYSKSFNVVIFKEWGLAIENPTPHLRSALEFVLENGRNIYISVGWADEKDNAIFQIGNSSISEKKLKSDNWSQELEEKLKKELK